MLMRRALGALGRLRCMDTNANHPFSMAEMRSGAWYLPGSAEAEAQHHATWELTREFNALGNTDQARSRELLGQMFSEESATPDIWAPLHLEYGVNTTFGPGCFMNFNCVILDIAQVTIGEGSMFGPACQLITVEHPVDDAARRAQGWERARPISIGANCWFGAGAMVMPGVSVGDHCVVAAGAVVTQDVPAGSLVAGVPARVIRQFS